MKPPAFDYVRPATIEEAIGALQEGKGEAKVLAGGQSLVPMLNFRLLRPSALIDINHIPGLAFIREEPEGLRVGALTRHYQLETSPLVKQRFPIITAAMAQVAHLAIRNLGTIGGSLAHADPAAELPMLCVLLGAKLTVRGPTGVRTIEAGDFFVGALTTVLGEAELLQDVLFPYLPAETGWGFEEVARRRGDFALAAVGAALTRSDGAVAQARIAVMGMADRPLRMGAAEQALLSKTPDVETVAAAAEAVGQAVEPAGDGHASADLRRHLADVLTRRAVEAAWRRAQGHSA
jgi:CO/xanthine dehydrogenase FAD-binding subunit